MKKPFFLLAVLLFIFTKTLPAQARENMDSVSNRLNQQLLEWKIKNEQADYYAKKDSASFSFNALIPVLGTLSGAAIGLIGLLIQARRNSKNETAAWQRTQNAETQRLAQIKQDENLKATKRAAAGLLKVTAIATHNLTWILWIAKNDPGSFNLFLISTHDEKMNTMYSKIAAAQIALSSYDKTLFDKTSDWVRKVYNYDGAVGRLTAAFKKGQLESVNELGKLWQEVYDFSLDLPGQFASILEIALPTKTNPVTQGATTA